MAALAFLTTNLGTSLLAVGILAIALGLFVPLWNEYQRALRAILAAHSKLQEAHQEGSFHGFEALSEWFTKQGPIGELWKQFQSALTYPEDDETPLRRTVPSGSIFNESTVIPFYVNVRTAQYLPSALTGAGILFTFVGLAVGIYRANTGLMANTLEEMRASLSHLLGGASTAFVTSVVGLVSSLIISSLIRNREHTIARACQALAATLDEWIPSTSIETLATELVRAARASETQLERFNTEFALSVAQALDERFAQRLTPKLEELIASVDALREERAVFNHDALARLVERFEESLRGAAGQELQALASTVHEIGTTLAGVKDALAAERDGMSRALESGLAAFEDGLKSLGTEVSGAAVPITEAAHRWVDALHEGEAMLQKVVGAVGELETALRGGTVSLDQAAQTLRAGASEVDAAIKRLLDLETVVEQTGARLEDGAASLQRGVESLEHVSRELRQHTQQLTQTWEQQRQRFEGLDQELTKAFSSMSTGLQGTTQQVGQLLGLMDKELAAALQQLGGIVHDLRELQEEIADHLEALRHGETYGRV